MSTDRAPEDVGEDLDIGSIETAERDLGLDYSAGDYRSLGYGEPLDSSFRKTRYDQTLKAHDAVLRDTFCGVRSEPELAEEAEPLH